MFRSALPALSVTSCRRSIQAVQFPKSKCAKVRREAKVFLTLLLRSPWKQALCRLRKTGSTTTVAPSLISSSSSDTLVDDASVGSSSTLRRKTVRFDDEPTVFFRTSRIRKPKRSSIKLPERPCLVRRSGDVSTPISEDTQDSDSQSIYEDCICDVTCPAAIASELDRVRLRHHGSCSSFLYESGSGTVEFNGQSYAEYCLAKYFDKQEESLSPLKLVLERPAPLPSPTTPRRSFKAVERPALACTTQHPPADTSLCFRIRRMQQCIVDEFENAVVVLAIGLTIYTCIFLFFLYNLFVRLLSR